MTQEQLAHRVGLAKATVCAIEKGHIRPSLDKAIDIAAVFGEPVEKVFALVEVPA